ncbi:hypothetical protein J8J04_00530 ['Fragaria x ananassa' phyllody phytoplasma]|uniref:Uncharacterized protein n=1 Tax='Fragaria x ananassa' phyllody phytoplasma TaxID=2358428 RepID=A0ABS5K2U8_9MOLU|nr:hypothetical protein ['Fragaria x ananassa' phyllody phytoplasma]MBS2126206.1 hypothetical protein ['Fragaria x ananassa' phyllody phytoplasma]
MNHYFQKFYQLLVCGFVSDNTFPVVYFEKGICIFSLKRIFKDPKIISIKNQQLF